MNKRNDLFLHRTKLDVVSRGFKFLKGFTLVEVLMALLIFSIIALSLYSTFNTAILAWRRTKDVNRVYREAKLSLGLISTSLKNATFFDFSRNYPDLKLFNGEVDKISFYISSDSGLKKISYFLEKPDATNIYRVVLGRRGTMPDRIVADYKQISEKLVSLKEKSQDFLNSLSQKNDVSQSSSLTSLVKEDGLKFSYGYIGGEAQSSETLVWKDSFESQNKIPKIIKITLTMLDPKNLKQERTFTKTVFIPTGELVTFE